ncbi:MAG: hypothetical protein U0791_19905 [Gemmataceae bacterium]
MSQAVQEIFERIGQLTDDDRAVFEEQLAQRLEAEWLREAAAARIEAARRGIDQAAIDRAVDAVRRGT